MMNGMKGADEKTEGGAGGGRVGAGGHGGSLTPSLDRVQPTAADSRAFAVAFPQPLAPSPPSPPPQRPPHRLRDHQPQTPQHLPPGSGRPALGDAVAGPGPGRTAGTQRRRVGPTTRKRQPGGKEGVSWWNT